MKRTPDGAQLARETSTPENNYTRHFEQTVLPHLDAAHNLARRLIRNKQDAEDMVQETYLRAFRYFASFHGNDARAWVLTIVRNTCLSWLSTNQLLRYNDEFDENLVPPDPRAENPENLLLLNDDGALVRKALKELPPNFRRILVLREIEGMSYREISDFTGVPAGTVMSSLSRARGRLYVVLTSLMNGDSMSSSVQTGAANTQ
jgi:RNA polymerase sigma-70 factor (ECF subfamily)